MVKGVVNNKYQGITLYQTDDDWPEVRQNIMRTRLFWRRLGTISETGRGKPKVLEMFYRAVAQAVLLFGFETRVLTSEMERKV